MTDEDKKIESGNKGIALGWTVVESAMIIAFTSMLIIMFIQVLSRYVLGVGVPWTDEASRFLFITEIFLGMAIAQRYGAQIRITILLDVLPRKLRLYFEVFSLLVTLIIVICLVVGAFLMMSKTANVKASTLNFSFSYLYLIQAVGFLLLITLIIRDIKTFFVKISALNANELVAGEKS